MVVDHQLNDVNHNVAMFIGFLRVCSLSLNPSCASTHDNGYLLAACRSSSSHSKQG